MLQKVWVHAKKLPMDLKSLVQVPEAQRNQAWENQFFQTLSQSQLSFMSMEPQTGPDGWPYMLMRTEGDQQESFQKLLFWLSTRGIGLVINPGKEYPDYVFTYGMLWHFRETGFFFMPVPERNHGVVEFHPQEVVNAGPPTEKYLPSYVRQVLRDFFRDQGILRPKILVMSTDNINYDLAISLESLKNPPEQEHQGIAEAIGWFLPPHYSILLVSENGLPSFGDL
ncbi:MAG: hypothetical protein ACK5P6_00685 [Pseudobdellovibrionaceae bacterium]|jgi:hypothetical protein